MEQITENPVSVDITTLSEEVLESRIKAIVKVVREPFINGIAATERKDNKEVIQTDELIGMHKRHYEIGRRVLGVIFGVLYVDGVEQATILKFRSGARLQETRYVASDDAMVQAVKLADMSFLKDTSLEKKREILQNIREYSQGVFEECFVTLERHDNGEEGKILSPGDHEYYSSGRNLAGMVIPYTDSAGFLFEWRKKLIDAYRDPSRDPEDFF